jgi:hypothetical protein
MTLFMLIEGWYTFYAALIRTLASRGKNAARRVSKSVELHLLVLGDYKAFAKKEEWIHL